MRILFFGTPAFGHLLPMLPLAQAAQRGGHEVAFLTNAAMAQALRPFQVLPSGPEAEVMLAEAARRTGSENAGQGPTPASVAEFFAGTRVDMSVDEALPAALTHAPDLIVAESADFVGPLVAAALKVPWAGYSVILVDLIGGPFGQAVHETVAKRYAARGLSPTPQLAHLDAFPALLRPPGWTPAPEGLSIQPQPHAQEGDAWTAPSFDGRDDRPRVLLTLGTVVDDPALLGAVLAALGAADVNVVVTLGTQEKADALEVDRNRVQPVGFVPLEQLLGGVNVVVSAGGAGTVLAALSRGLPMVVLPVTADQPVNAAQVAAAGAGVVVRSPDEVGAAVQEVLATPAYQASAQKVAEQISRMNTPERVLGILSERMTALKS